MNKTNFRKTVSLLLCLMLALTFVPTASLADTADTVDLTSVAEFTAECDKSAAEYKISSAESLIALSTAVQDGTFTGESKTFYLASDIDLKDELFTPIASQTYPTYGFAGTFNGCFKTISGLNITSASGAGVGLFGTVNGGTVKNLKVSGSVKGTNSNFVGGIVGKTQGSVTIENCSFEGSVTADKSGSTAGAGGIAGRVNAGSLTITSCANLADITAAKGAAAGILGTGQANKIHISSCYNKGNITSQWNSSGICANNTKNTSSIDSCYSTGEISNSNGGTNCAGISANYKGTASNCYSTLPAEDKFASNANGKSTKVSETEITAEKLGSEFKDAEGGTPILKWQETSAEEPKNPEIKIIGASALYMTTGAQTAETLTAKLTDIDDAVTWDVTSGSDVISLSYPENPDALNTILYITPEKGGKATVTATAGEYSDTFEVVVYPYISGAEFAGYTAVGETVFAKITVLGGKPYDFDNMPELNITWLCSDSITAPFEPISGAFGRSFTIPESLEGKYLYYRINNITSERNAPSRAELITPAADVVLKADYDALTLDTEDIKAPKTLELTKKGGRGSDISWSADSTLFNAETGEITLPESGISDITVTAEISYAGRTKEKSFKIRVYSLKQLEEDKNNKLLQIDKALAPLGDFYTLCPEYGKDTNVFDMFCASLAEDRNADIKINIQNIEEIQGGAEIAENGDITYFYADPNTTPLIHFGRVDVTFRLTLRGEYKEIKVPVTIYWDRARVEKTMTSEILDKVDFEKNENGFVEAQSDLSLPKVVDGKKWCLIKWTSSDETALSVSSENSQTPDTFYNPYAGKLHRGVFDKEVTLTAEFPFAYTSDVTGSEKPIVLRKSFKVLVKADPEKVAEIQASLNSKLDAGFAAKGLRSAVTEQPLTQREDGKYILTDDILFPTTRDFGIDGKYFPVSIESSNEDVVSSPDVNNAARAEVIRPAAGQPDAKVTLTLKITDLDSGMSVSRTFDFSVPALTNNEIAAEKALMEKVKTNYFEGIRGRNELASNIAYDLSPFVEVYEENGELIWVRDVKSAVNHGIVPTPINGWEELEAWRLFKSSNPAVISHENLIINMQNKAKSVTVSSVLSSETLGKYGKLYASDNEKYAAYKDLADLYYIPVSADIIVRGRLNYAGSLPTPEPETISVSFTLMDNSETVISKVTYDNLEEGTTAFDIFKKALAENGCTYETYGNRGSYVTAVTLPDGTRLAAFDRGKNSGWMFKVNGKFPDTAMAGCGLKDGDSMVFLYTDDYELVTEDRKHSSSSSSTGTSSSSESGNTKDDKPQVTPEPSKSPEFSDISGHWAEDIIKLAAEKGYMNGTAENTFSPDALLTRAMLVTILYNAEGKPESGSAKFEDVKDGAWYEKAVAWASENGLVKGVSENLFAPDENITREQTATILYRYAVWKKIEGLQKAELTSFADASAISEYAREALEYITGSGIMKGDENYLLNPLSASTRAEIAAMIIRLLN